MVQGAKVQKFPKQSRNLPFVYAESRMNASFQSALARKSSLWIKMLAHASMQTPTYTISGIEISPYRQHCSSERREWLHWSETPDRDVASNREERKESWLYDDLCERLEALWFLAQRDVSLPHCCTSTLYSFQKNNPNSSSAIRRTDASSAAELHPCPMPRTTSMKTDFICIELALLKVFYSPSCHPKPV